MNNVKDNPRYDVLKNPGSDPYLRAIHSVLTEEEFVLYRTFPHWCDKELRKKKGDVNQKIHRLIMNEGLFDTPEIIALEEARRIEEERMNNLSEDELIEEFVDVIEKGVKSGKIGKVEII